MWKSETVTRAQPEHLHRIRVNHFWGMYQNAHVSLLEPLPCCSGGRARKAYSEQNAVKIICTSKKKFQINCLSGCLGNETWG